MKKIIIDYRTLLTVQRKLVQKHSPHWRFAWESEESAYFEGEVVSPTGAVRLLLRLVITPRLPHLLPPLYVMQPKILRRVPEGTINEVGRSTTWHTWEPSPTGCVGICHAHPWDWDASSTYVRPILVGAMWASAYEAHLEDGSLISDYFAR